MKSLAAALLVLLSACTGVSVQALRPVTPERALELAAPHDWNEAHDLFGRAVSFHYTLAAGRYRGRYADADGTYYGGPAFCMQKEVVSSNIPETFRVGRVDSYECGIYVPHTASGVPKVYFFNPGGGHDGAARAVPGSGRENDRITETAVATATATPGATPLQSGIGAGIGAGIGGMVNDAMIEARRVNIQFLAYQPDGKGLGKAIVRVDASKP